jgi:hypothetical protein
VEQRFDLVPAEEHDELIAWTRACHARAAVLRAAVRPLTAQSSLADAERAYRELQHAARRAATVTPRAGQWERGWAALASVVPPDA